MADREKKGEDEYKEFEYLQNEKSFLKEIRNISHSFWRAIIWWKIKFWQKIADTSFKDLYLNLYNVNSFVKTCISVKVFVISGSFFVVVFFS